MKQIKKNKKGEGYHDQEPTNEIERYTSTPNDHYNQFAFKLLLEVRRTGIFEDPLLPLGLFDGAIEGFCREWKQPVTAVDRFKGMLEADKLTDSQKLFVVSWCLQYIEATEFDDGINLNQSYYLLKIEKQLLEERIAEQQPPGPLIANLRTSLKDILLNELEKLPQYLSELEPRERLQIICKLMPFALPKVYPIHSDKGE